MSLALFLLPVQALIVAVELRAKQVIEAEYMDVVVDTEVEVVEETNINFADLLASTERTARQAKIMASFSLTSIFLL